MPAEAIAKDPAQALRPKYNEPANIPEEITTAPCGDEVAPLSDGSGVVRGYLAVCELARSVVRDALSLPTSPEAYLEYWTEHVAEFTGLLKTVSTLAYAADVSTDVDSGPRSESRKLFVNGSLAGAHALLGSEGVRRIRRAIADTFAAYGIVSRYPSSKALNGDSTDKANAALYNYAQGLLDASLTAVFGSALEAVRPEIVEAVVILPGAAAQNLLQCATSGASRRDVSCAFDLDWAIAAGFEPNGELIDYLTLRAPELIDDHLREVCSGFDRLDLLADGTSADGPLSSSDVSQPPTTEENVETWAAALAEDLAAIHD